MGFFEQALANKLATTGQGQLQPPAPLDIPQPQAPVQQMPQVATPQPQQGVPQDVDPEEKQQQLLMTGLDVFRLMQQGIKDPQQMIPQLKAIDEQYPLVSLDEVFGVVQAVKKSADFLGPAMSEPDESGSGLSRLGKWLEDNPTLTRLGMAALGASTKGSTAEYDIGGKLSKAWQAQDTLAAQTATEKEKIASDERSKQATLQQRQEENAATEEYRKANLDIKKNKTQYVQDESGNWVLMTPEQSGKVKGKEPKKDYELLDVKGQLQWVEKGAPIPKGAKKPKTESSGMSSMWSIFYGASKNAGMSDVDIVKNFKNLATGNASPQEVTNYRKSVREQLVNNFTEIKDPITQARLMTDEGKVDQLQKFMSTRDSLGDPYLKPEDLNYAESTVMTQLGFPAHVVDDVKVFRKQGAKTSDIIRAIKISMAQDKANKLKKKK